MTIMPVEKSWNFLAKKKGSWNSEASKKQKQNIIMVTMANADFTKWVKQTKIQKSTTLESRSRVE